MPAGADRRQFPGEKSPGLIEAAMDAPSAARSRAFPGEKSPGLIEARERGPVTGDMGAGFPGEKSPGLIEANRFGSENDRSVRQVSGGEIPRPH